MYQVNDQETKPLKRERVTSRALKQMDNDPPVKRGIPNKITTL